MMRATKSILLTLPGFVALSRTLMWGLLLLVSMAGCGKIKGDGRWAGDAIRIKVVGSDTKAPVITTEELEKKGRFALDAYVDDEYYDYRVEPPQKAGDAGLYVDSNNQANVYKMGTTWELKMGGDYVPWIADLTTRFFCYWPAQEDLTAATRSITQNSDHPESGSLSFEYSLSGSLSSVGANLLSSGDGSSLVKPVCSDADRMDDIIFAYNEVNFDGSNDAIDIKFYHALSQVRFCVDLEDGTFDRHLVIKQIALRNVKEGGSCEFDGSACEFKWDTESGSLTSYCQSYDADFSSSIPSEWPSTSIYDPLKEEFYTALANTDVFFIVPQTISGAEVSIVFSDGGTLYERTVNIPDFTYLPGACYTYKISASDLGRDIGVTLTLVDWNNYDDKLFI